MKLSLVSFAILVCLISRADSLLDPVVYIVSELLGTILPGTHTKVTTVFRQPIGSGTITVGGKCIDLSSVCGANATPLQISTCKKTSTHDFTVRADGTIRALGKCMQVQTGRVSNFSPVQLHNCNGTPEQQWVFLSSGQVKNVRSNKCLDVKYSRIKDGQPLVIYSCRKSVVVSQTFTFSFKSTVTIKLPPITPIKPPPTNPNEPKPTKPNEPKPTKPNEPEPTKPNEPKPTKPNEPEPTKPNEPKPPKPNEPKPTKPNDPKPTKPNEPKPTKPNEPKPTKPNEPPSPPPIIAQDPQPSGTCEIKVADKCVEVTAGNTASGTQLSVYTCNDTPAQDWIVQGDGTIRAYGKCMDVKDGATDNLTPVQLWDCNETEAQQWVFLSSGQLKNPKSNRCLDVEGGGTLQDGQPLIIYDCKETDFENQAFESTCKAAEPPSPTPIIARDPQPSGTCEIKVADKCVEVTGGNSASGTQLSVYTCNDTPAQDWIVQGDGTIRAYGKCMDVKDGATDNLTPVQLWDCNETEAQQWVFLSSGQLKNPKSNRCLDVEGGGTLQDGQPLIIYDCKETDFENQAFESTCKAAEPPSPTPIIARDPQPSGTCEIKVADKCVEVTGGNSASGTQLSVYTCNDTPAQDWIVQGDGTIRAYGKCMDVRNGATDNLTPVQLWDCNETEAQQWVFLSSGQLKNPKSNRCLDVEGGGTLQDGQPLIIYDCKETDFENQAFESTCNAVEPPAEPPSPSPIIAQDPQPSGTCEIKVADKCVEVTGGNSASGTQLSVYTCNDTPAQDWIVQGDGTIRAYGKCMDVRNGATDNLTPVQLWDCNETEAQQWVFLSSGQLKNPKSNRCLDVEGGGTLQDGQLLIIYDCKETDFENQAFESTCNAVEPPAEPPSPSPIIAQDPQPSGTCEIKVADKCVEVTAGNSASGTQLSVYTCNDTPAQDWIVQGDGTIRAYGKCMDVRNGATDNLTPVQLWDCNETEAQQWVFLSSGQLKNPKSDRCLDVEGGGTLQDGQLLIIYDCKETDFENQAFESTCNAVEPPAEPPSPSPIIAQDPQPSGTCEIKVADKCVEVTAGNTASGTQLSVYTCNDTPAQDWIVQGDGTIRAYGKCMDVKDGATDNLTPVQLWDCNETEAQQWVFLSSGQLKNPKSNRCLDVEGGGTLQDGQPLIIYDCKETDFENQAFESTCKAAEPPSPTPIIARDPQPSGTCEIKVADKCVEVTGGNSASGTQLSVYTCNDTPAQDWIVQGDGTIRAYGKCMDVKDGATDNLTPVQLWDCNETEAQQWVFLSSGQLKNPKSNRCLDVEGGGTLQDGQPLIIYDCKETDFENQAFESTCNAVEPPAEPPSPSPIIAQDPQPSGTCEIKVADKCVEVTAGNSASGTQLSVYTCNDTPAQDWIVQGDGTIRAYGKCMDVRNGATDNLTPVQLWDCNETEAQQWVFLSSGQLKNPKSNRCLDVEGGGTLQDGQLLIIYDCKETDFENQAFESTCNAVEPPAEPPSPSPIIAQDPQPSGTCEIKVADKCVEVTAGNSASGTQLSVYTCNDTPAQDWIVQGDGTIRAYGKCMDVKDGATDNLTPVQLWDCNETEAQQWVFLSSGQLKNPKSNRCLDVEGGGTLQDGQPLIIYDCKETDFENQAFESTCKAAEPPSPTPIIARDPQPSGTCEIKVADKCVEVTGGNSASGTQLSVYTCNDTPAQDWIVQGDGTIRAYGKCMDVRNGATDNLTPVQLWDCNETEAQQWVFLSSGQLKNPKSNRCLDVEGGGTLQDGQPLIIYDCKETDFENQAFESTCNAVEPPAEPPSPSPIIAQDPQPSGTCEIKVADKCVEVTAGNSASGTQLSVYTCNDTPAQDWIVQGDGTIRAYGKCMDVRNGATDNLTPVQLWDCNETEAQQWVFLSSGQLKNPKSNRCLDVEGGGTLQDGQPLIIYDCKETDFENQAFESTCNAVEPPAEPPSPSPIIAQDPQPSGTCEIKVADKCVEVTAGNSASGTQLSVYTCNDTPAQDWIVQGDGTIRAYGKCMDVRNGATDNLTPVQLWDCNETEAQQWVFLSSGQLKNPKSNRCLDVEGGGTLQDGQLLIIYDCKETDFENQAFESTCNAVEPPAEPPSPSPIIAQDPQPSGTCEIKVADKCVEVTAGNTASGTQLSVYTCNDTPAQDWIVQGDGTIRAYGKCMDVKDGATDNLTPVQLWDCNETEAQQWVFLSSGQLKNPKSNRCLDVEGGGTLQDGQPLIIYDCKETDFENQAFESTCKAAEPPSPTPIIARDPQPSGTCEIKVADKCVEVTGGNSASGTQLSVYTCNDTPAQDWIVQGDGTIRAYGKCMDVKDGATDNLTPVQLWDCNETEAQQWVFLSSGQLKNPKSNRCLDVEGGGTLQDGQPLIIYDCKETDFENQAFESTCNAVEPPAEPPSPSPIIAQDPQPSGTCEIKVADKCVEVTAGNSASGTQLSVYTCNDTPAQDWIVQGDGTIRAYGKCMDVRNGATDNLTPVQLWDCNETEAQQWVFLSSGQLKNPKSNRCLDVEGGGTLQDGQLLIIYDCKETDFENQAFESTCNAVEPPAEPPSPSPIIAQDPQPSGTCEIKVADKCVEVTAGNSASGTQLSVYTCNDTPAQDWIVQGDGTIRAYGKCMDVKDGATDNLTPVQLWDCNETEAQQWVFLSSGQLKNPKSNRCLDVEGGGTLQDGQPLIIYDCKETDFENQAFESTCKAAEPPSPTPIIARDPQPSGTSPPQIIAQDPQPSGTCELKVADKCVDVTGGNSASGTQLSVYTCNDTPAQNWIVQGDGTIRAYDKCMDVRNGATDNLTPVQLWDCNETEAQQWVFLSSGQLKNTKSNRCLDVEGGGTLQDGQPLIIYDCKETDFENQAFESTCEAAPPPIIAQDPQPSGTCELKVADKCVDVTGGNSASGTQLSVYTCNDTPAQDWILQGDGTIRAYDKCVDVRNGATDNLTPVQLWDCNETEAQQWIILSSGQLKNTKSNRCLDVEGGGTLQDGQPLIIYDCKETDFENQYFEIICDPV